MLLGNGTCAAETYFQPFIGLCGYVGSETCLSILIAFEDTALLVEVTRCIVEHLICTAADGNCMVLLKTSTKDIVSPLGVHIATICVLNQVEGFVAILGSIAVGEGNLVRAIAVLYC